jgi:hypothetical protein
MKTKHLLLLFCLVFFASCTIDDESDKPSTPKKDVPAEYAKSWLYGTFSMSEFWSHSGEYLGNAFELSVAFKFTPDGNFEKYFVAQSRNYSCVTQAFTFAKGTVVFDEAAKTFTIYPTEGRYRGFDNCIDKNNLERPFKSEELKSETYYYDMITDEYGKTYFTTKFKATDEYASHFREVNW